MPSGDTAPRFAQAQAAKEALARAEIEKKRLDLKLKRAEMAAGKTDGETIPPAPAATAPTPAQNGDTACRFDGSYEGHLCNERSERHLERKCWFVQLQVAQNELSASWPVGRLGKTGQVRGTISADGEVIITLDGWKEDGRPSSRSLTGKWEDKAIHAAGKWQGGRPITGEWQRGE